MSTAVDVVVVSYNSESKLDRCLSSVAGTDGVHVFVVDNDSQDASVAVASSYPATVIPVGWNSGFAHGCNVGWRAGTSPYVLFLNPDAAIDEVSLARLVDVLDQDATIGVAAPSIVHEDGARAHSLRRYPTLGRAFAQAFFVHRVLPHSEWTDEVVREDDAYDHRWSPDWLSGACLLVRRDVLEELDGWDERFFLYSEDVDLCRRVRDAGYGIAYEPGARCIHTGGASAPSATVLPLIAESRLIYALKHEKRSVAALYSLAIAASSVTHAAVSRGSERRRAHLRAARQTLAALGGRQ
jgi:N-acetylglucosaminyl-diphospho-decaprenol L-rhamnosyltransferase